MSNLKPCPFCGGEAECNKWWSATIAGKYATVCTKCSCGTDYYYTEAEAISAWNTRAERTCINVGCYIDATRFKCSECGYNGWTKYANDGRDRVPRFCPNCGAKVVDE